ncbi:MAG: thiopurine S-methyltransferase [Bacteroidota bacterium]
MEASFWIKSWELGGFHTSFHRKDIHPYVLQYMTPEAIEGKNVLVPLCGKTIDMLYLAQYANKVIGVEIAEEAIIQFFYENNLQVIMPDEFTYVSGNITIIRRSFMELTPKDLGPVDWILDRASLVALPYDMRVDYLKAIDRLSEPGTKQLVITLEYFPLLDSAPFSIPPAEVNSYYDRGHIIQHVESPSLPNHGMVKRWKLEYLVEHGFVITKYANGYIMANEKQSQLSCR